MPAEIVELTKTWSQAVIGTTLLLETTLHTTFGRSSVEIVGLREGACTCSCNACLAVKKAVFLVKGKLPGTEEDMVHELPPCCLWISKSQVAIKSPALQFKIDQTSNRWNGCE